MTPLMAAFVLGVMLGVAVTLVGFAMWLGYYFARAAKAGVESAGRIYQRGGRVRVGEP